MSANDEVDNTPLPPWAGVKFTCFKCTGEFQLEASDKCEPGPEPLTFETPACPTPGCGAINLVNQPGYRQQWESTNGAPDEEVGGS